MDNISSTETRRFPWSCAYRGGDFNLTLHVQDNEIVKVTSPHDNPVAHGNLRIEGRCGFTHVQNRD